MMNFLSILPVYIPYIKICSLICLAFDSPLSRRPSSHYHARYSSKISRINTSLDTFLSCLVDAGFVTGSLAGSLAETFSASLLGTFSASLSGIFSQSGPLCTSPIFYNRPPENPYVPFQILKLKSSFSFPPETNRSCPP